MTDPLRLSRYRRLFAELGDEQARAMLDKLQIVALTSPDTMRELEGFLDRKLAEHRKRKDHNRKTDSNA